MLPEDDEIVQGYKRIAALHDKNPKQFRRRVATSAPGPSAGGSASVKQGHLKTKIHETIIKVKENEDSDDEHLLTLLEQQQQEAHQPLEAFQEGSPAERGS